MKLRDQIASQRLDRSAQRIGMSDEMSGSQKHDFLCNVRDEHRESYRRLGVPENKISLVQSMSTRTREFFGWEKGLEIVLAYRKGDARKFQGLLSDYFQDIGNTDAFTGYDIEMMLDMLGANKAMPDTPSLINRVKRLWQELQVNTEGGEEIKRWIKRNSIHFYEIGYQRQMTGTEVYNEFLGVDVKR